MLELFGRDDLVWDKWTGNVRIDTGNGATLLTNIHNETGNAYMNGKVMVQTLQLADATSQKYLDQSLLLANNALQIKRFRSNTHVVEEATQDGRMADKLNMTLKEWQNTSEHVLRLG